VSTYDDITDWQEWRRNLTPEETEAALLHSGEPYLPGTCYPLPRYILLHTIDPEILKAIPNPFAHRRRIA